MALDIVLHMSFCLFLLGIFNRGRSQSRNEELLGAEEDRARANWLKKSWSKERRITFVFSLIPRPYWAFLHISFIRIEIRIRNYIDIIFCVVLRLSLF